MKTAGEHVVILHNDAVHDTHYVRQALETAAALTAAQADTLMLAATTMATPSSPLAPSPTAAAYRRSSPATGWC